MRSICNINFHDAKLNGQLIVSNEKNELILKVSKLDEQLTDIFVVITGVNGEVKRYTYENKEIEVKKELFNGKGNMTIQVVSNEINSQPINISCIDFNDNDNIYCKYVNNQFTFKKLVAGGGDFNIDKVYPLGAIYISVLETSPSDLFGGTWERFANGKTLIGVDENDADFNTVKKTGGEKSHTLTVQEMPTHTHAQNAHNHTGSSGSAGAHTHTISGSAASAGAHGHSASSNSTGSHTHKVGSDLDAYERTSGARVYSVHRSGGSNVSGAQYQDNSGSAGAHSHTISVGSGGAHTHSVSGSAGSNGAHTHTVSVGSTTAVNQNTGGSGAHNNIPPYITVYMWVRIA